jgi:hypothetical protein
MITTLLFCIYGSLSNWIADQKITDWIQAVAVIYAGVVGARALNTWKEQKHQELIIKFYGISEHLNEVIKHLRNPISSESELDDESKKMYDKQNAISPEEAQYFYASHIIQSRWRQHQEVRNNALMVLQEAKVLLNDDHIMIRYLEEFLDIEKMINRASRLYPITLRQLTKRNNSESLEKTLREDYDEYF